MKEALLNNPTPPMPIESEAFWRQHQQLHKASGLSRVDYCRRNNLNYDRFGYWISKWNRQSSSPSARLVAVKLKPSSEVVSQTTFSTLHFNNGCFLKIHDSHVLSLILDRMR